MWKKAIEEHHAILFMIRADMYEYGKLIEDMKNDVLRKKDLFLKTITEACHILSKWKNQYGVYTMAIEVNQLMVLPSQQ